MAKIGGQWRGFVPGIGLACLAAGLVMAGLGWLDRDLSTIGGDLLSGARKFLQVDEQQQTAPPARADIYAQTGRNPLEGAGVSLPSLGASENEETILANHAARGAIVGHASVVDGDSLSLNGRPVRLWGIDAPELLQNCASSGRWQCGQDAKSALTDFIAQHRIACYDKGFDEQGHMVAQCFLGNIDINGWVARNGWAFALRDKTLEYASRESAAKMKGTGMWRATGIEAPREWRRQN